MKLKEISRTAATAWAPTDYQLEDHGLSALMCSGSIAGAMDDSFSSTTDLEIFAMPLGASTSKEALRLANTSVHTRYPVACLVADFRFQRLAWTSAGVGSADRPLGMILGGMDDGSLDLWNPHALLHNQNALLLQKKLHATSLKALDVNPFQPSLIATGASAAEIFVLDLNQPDKAFGPGGPNKSQRLDDITCLAWNRQVQHILASAAQNGASVIWDLKNRREVVYLGNPDSRRPVTAIAWHPDVATKILTASDDDLRPVIYMWDLRNAHAPEKVLSEHSKGILSMAWSSKDSDLLLSCGKDNRTICWNPNQGEVVGEFPVSRNWTFDVQWCPRNPDLFSVSSFDGKVRVYSLQSTGDEANAVTPGAPLMNDPFAFASTTSPATQGFQLKQPPKWMRRSVGAVFGFGNRLATFSWKRDSETPKSVVNIRQLSVDPELSKRSKRLEEAVQQQNFVAYCQEQAQLPQMPEAEKMQWQLMGIMLQPDCRSHMVKFLGFDSEHLSSQLASLKIPKSPVASSPTKTVRTPADAASTLVHEMINGAVDNSSGDDSSHIFGASSPKADDFSRIGVNPPSPTGRHPLSASHVPPSTGTRVFADKAGSLEALVTRCLTAGEFEKAVELCVRHQRWDDALVISIAGGQELMERTRDAFLQRPAATSYNRLLASIAHNDLESLLNQADVKESWRELLVVGCTYATSDELTQFSDAIGNLLQSDLTLAQKDPKRFLQLFQATVFCFLLAGNVDKVVTLWVDQMHRNLQPFTAKLDSKRNNFFATREYASAVQQFMEKWVVLKQIVRNAARSADDATAALALKSLNRIIAHYAHILSLEGCTAPALAYLQQVDGDNEAELIKTFKHRLYSSLAKHDAERFDAPERPFAVINYKPAAPAVAKPANSYYAQQGAARQAPSVSTTGYQYAQQPQQQQQPQQPQYGYGQQQTATAYQSQAAPAYSAQATNYGNYAAPQAAAPAPTPYNPYQYGSTGYNNSQPMIPQPGQGSYGTMQPQQSQVSPHSQQKAAGGFNDPPADIFKTKPANRPVSTMQPITQPVQPSYPPYNPNPYGMPNAAPQQAPLAPPPTNVTAPTPISQQVQQQRAPGYAPAQQPVPAPMQMPQQPYQQQQQQQAYAPYAPNGMQSPVQTQAPAMPPVPEKKRHPMGDRTHILPEHKPVFEVLSRTLNQCKPIATPPQKRVLEDTEKRLNYLYDRLNNQEMPDALMDVLMKLSKSLDSKDWNGAAAMQADMMSRFPNEGTQWMTGIKRLIDAAKALP